MKILLLDTNLASLPIYNYLLKLGYDVYVVGSNNKDTLAVANQNYIEMDYSDAYAISDYMNQNDFTFAIPGCNDVSYRVAALLNEMRRSCLNISPAHVDETLNNKVKFKKFALLNGLKVPKLFKNESFSEFDDKRIVVKPTDAYSGRGVTMLSNFNAEQLQMAIENAKANSQTNDCLIEEYVSGSLYSHSAFVVNGEFVEDFIVQEFCTVYPYAVDTSWVVEKEKFLMHEKIKQEVKKIIVKLDLCDGLIHTQFVVDGSDFWILEVTRRCPGDLFSKLIEYSTGFEYASYYAALILNLNQNSQAINKHRNVLRKTLTFEAECTWYSLQNTNSSLQFLEYFPTVFSGARLLTAPKGRAGIAFFLFKSTPDLKNL